MEVDYEEFACYTMNRYCPEIEESQLSVLNRLKKEGAITIVNERITKINNSFLEKCFREKVDFGSHSYCID